MSFFIRKSKAASREKRKVLKRRKIGKNVSTTPQQKNDEEITSEEEEEEEENQKLVDSDSDHETAQEKKLRLTKKYLEEIEREEKERQQADDDGDVVGSRLRDELLEKRGRLKKSVWSSYKGADIDNVTILRCKDHKLPVTCAVISPDDQFVYTASKDCSIVKWSLQTLKRVKSIPGGRKGTEAHHKGHTATVLGLAISSDHRYLVSGCLNGTIHVWNPETLDLLHTFRGHRGGISGLIFRHGTHMLYSSSLDRSVRIWSLDEMAFVETLFGHQDSITSIDALMRERAVTSGGRDNSIRVWKIIEESQLVFNGHGESIDGVKFITDENFLSCGDDGSISLWSVMKKKPLHTVHHAHGVSPVNQEPNWICALATLPNTDLVASGSYDGTVKVWKCTEGHRSLEELFTIPVKGFVNALCFTNSGDRLVFGVGQEHRLGRWWRDNKARNSVHVVPLKMS